MLRRKSALVVQGSLRVKALLLIFWLIFKSIRRKFYSHMTLIMIISLSKYQSLRTIFFRTTLPSNITLLFFPPNAERGRQEIPVKKTSSPPWSIMWIFCWCNNIITGHNKEIICVWGWTKRYNGVISLKKRKKKLTCCSPTSSWL